MPEVLSHDAAAPAQRGAWTRAGRRPDRGVLGSSAAPGTAHARDVGRPTRAGCYQVSIKFPGTPRERRARYQGITRSGSAPIHPDPDQDFLRVMPGYMPEGTLVLDCLERPDQTQAHGAYSFPGNDPSPWPEVPQITIKWSFTCRAR